MRCLHAVVVERLVERAGELRHDRGRRALRREDAGPDAHLVVDAELLRRRHVGQRGEPLGRRDAVGLDRAGLHLLGDADRLFAEEVDVAADHVVHRRIAAAIGDRGGLRADLRVEQQACHVRRRADAAVALLQCRAAGFQQRDKFLQVLRWKILPRDDDGGRMRGRPDRHEVARGIVLDVWRQHRSGDVRSHAAGQQRIAIGRCGCDSAAAEGTACAAGVLDHQRLAEHLAHLVGHDARDHVAWAACRKRDDHGDGAGRKILGHDHVRIAHNAAITPAANTRARVFDVMPPPAQSSLKISATSTRRPSRADKMPARTTASEVVA